MSFKDRQKVRIKGTDVVGEHANTYDGITNVEVRGPSEYGSRTLLKDYYVPEALVEAVIEPITVTFDPVELPVTVNSSLTTIEVNSRDGWVNLESQEPFDSDKFVRSLRHDQARKLAYAILSITEAGK